MIPVILPSFFASLVAGVGRSTGARATFTPASGAVHLPAKICPANVKAVPTERATQLK